MFYSLEKLADLWQISSLGADIITSAESKERWRKGSAEKCCRCHLLPPAEPSFPNSLPARASGLCPWSLGGFPNVTSWAEPFYPSVRVSSSVHELWWHHLAAYSQGWQHYMVPLWKAALLKFPRKWSSILSYSVTNRSWEWMTLGPYAWGRGWGISKACL